MGKFVHENLGQIGREFLFREYKERCGKETGILLRSLKH